jgi:voltage-gated potassium channel
MISRCRYLIWLIWKKIVHRPVLSILLILIFIYLGATFVVMAYEDIGFGSAAMKIFPAFFGEVGEVATPYIAVQISIIIGIIVSVTFLAVITAKITSALIEFIRRGGSMAKKVNFSGHTIICGWNFQGKRVVKELLAATVMQQRGIVVLTESDQRPVEDERVEFIKGDPSQDESLIRAGIERADSVIVLSDCTKGSNEADAEALMVVLAVESLNREVHTCVQLMNSANRVHLEHAHADEIICLDQMGGSLLVASALNHGVAYLVTDLLTFDKGSEFYRYDRHLSEEMVGQEFSQAVQLLAQKHMILLAVETNYTEELQQQLSTDIIYRLPEVGRAMIVNPQSRYQIRQGDALFLVAESEPTRL